MWTARAPLGRRPGPMGDIRRRRDQGAKDGGGGIYNAEFATPSDPNGSIRACKGIDGDMAGCGPLPKTPGAAREMCAVVKNLISVDRNCTAAAADILRSARGDSTRSRESLANFYGGRVWGPIGPILPHVDAHDVVAVLRIRDNPTPPPGGFRRGDFRLSFSTLLSRVRSAFGNGISQMPVCK